MNSSVYKSNKLNKISERKKILFVSSFTPPLNAGGGKNAFNFASFLAEKGQQVTLLSLNRKGRLAWRESIKQLRIVRLLYFNHNLITKILSLFIILPGYLYYVAKNELVFIYGGNIIGFEFIILFGRILGKKIVFRSTMFKEDDPTTLTLHPTLGRLRKWILLKIDFYFSLNPAFTKSSRKLFANDQIIESLQGVNTSIYSPVYEGEKIYYRKKLNLPEDKLIIISIGYLIRRKGYNKMFEILANADFDYHLIFLGDYEVSDYHYFKHLNPEMKKLVSYGKELLKEKLQFNGPKENVFEYLKASDIYILNSKQEGFPNALLEAMSVGLPCIVRNIPGHYDFITEQDNLFNFQNQEELLSVLKLLNKNASLRIETGLRARKTIMKKASFEKVWELWQSKFL